MTARYAEGVSLAASAAAASFGIKTLLDNKWWEPKLNRRIFSKVSFSSSLSEYEEARMTDNQNVNAVNETVENFKEVATRWLENQDFYF